MDQTRGRGRPRDPAITPKVLEATRQVVAEVGVRAASMSAIADRAGVGKPTIYLRWANLGELVGAAIADLDLDGPGLRRLDAAFEAIDALCAMSGGRFLLEASLLPSARDALDARAGGERAAS